MNKEISNLKMFLKTNKYKNKEINQYNKKDIDLFLSIVIKVILYDYIIKEDELDLYLKLLDDSLNKLLSKDDKDKFISSLIKVRELLDTSLISIYQNDPSTTSFKEIVLSYVTFKAITYYRIAHELYLLNYKVLARIISEISKEETAIDINPGASIGSYFFIDHGIGIVIGETSIIGNNVKIYQGVTLGALNLNNPNNLRNKKRHPTILNNVTIYANASIFGGDTVIGNNVIIGANVTITQSIKDNVTIKLNRTNYELTNNK